MRIERGNLVRKSGLPISRTIIVASISSRIALHAGEVGDGLILLLYGIPHACLILYHASLRGFVEFDPQAQLAKFYGCLGQLSISLLEFSLKLVDPANLLACWGDSCNICAFLFSFHLMLIL